MTTYFIARTLYHDKIAKHNPHLASTPVLLSTLDGLLRNSRAKIDKKPVRIHF